MLLRPKKIGKWRDDPHLDVLRKDFSEEIESLKPDGKLTDAQVRFLRSRWLEQVLWMEHYAERCQSF